jgi:hypothetical protein
MIGEINITCPIIIAAGENNRPNPPIGPAFEINKKTRRPIRTVGILYKVCMTLIRSLLPGKLRKWIKQPMGRQISIAIVQEVAAIHSDLPAISITSRSSDTISCNACTNPSQSSVN